MKVLCAWCEKEGKPALIGEREPLEDPAETHGICPEHRRQVEAAFQEVQARAEALREEAEERRKKVDP